MKLKFFSSAPPKHTPRNNRKLAAPFAAALALSVNCISTLRAGTTWDGEHSGTDTNIDTKQNWDGTGSNLPDISGGTAIVTFGTGGSTATINTNANFLGIVLNRDANFSIANGAGSLTLGASGITMTLSNTTSRTHTISESNLILSASQTWSITNNTGLAQLNVSSVISGSFGITKTGSGTLNLSGANTYTGATTIRNGTVVVGVSDVAATSGAFGNVSSSILLTDASSGSSDNVSLLNGAFSLARNISVQNNAAAGVTTIGNNSGTSTFTGTVTLAKDVTLTSTGTQAIFRGVIGGAGNIHITGAGNTVQFNGAAANTYAGTAYVDSGTLNLNKTSSGVGNQITGNVAVSSGATLSLSNFGSQIVDTANVAIAGTFNMNASNSETIGTLAVTEGSVNTSSSILTLGTAGTQLTMTGGIILLGSTGTAGKLSLNGDVAINSSASVAAINTQSSPTGSTVDLNAATRTFNVATGTGAALGSELSITASVIGNANVGLTKAGGGTMVLSGTNTYTGITSINDGTLIVNGSQSSATGAVSVASIAKLFGNGTIGGATTVHGTQSSGASGAVGTTQTFSSSLTYSTGSIFEWDINVVGGVDTHDKLVANSLLGSGAVFKIVGSGDGFAALFWNSSQNWSANDLFGANNINVNLSTIFSGANTTFTANPTEGSFSFTSTGGGTNNNLKWTAIPEPTSALAGILLGAGLLRRKRSQRQLA